MPRGRFGEREVTCECGQEQGMELAGVDPDRGHRHGGWWIAGHRVFGRPTAEAEKKSPKNEPRAIAVTVEPVTARSVRRTVTVVGSLYGREEVAVSPKVEGRIIKIRHDVGDRVRPGD